MIRHLRAAYRLVASPRLAVTLMLSWVALMVVWAIPFVFYGLPADQIARIVTEELFFRILYVLLSLATATCIAARISVLIRRVRRAPSPNSAPRSGRHASFVCEGEWSSNRAQSALRALGMSGVVVTDTWAWGVRNRYAPLGTILLHTALLLIVAASVVPLVIGPAFEATAAVTEGETFDSQGKDPFAEELKTDAPVPDVAFTLNSLQPRFHEDLLLFTKLEGILSDKSGRVHRMRLGSPWFVSPTTMVSVEDFGYSAEARIVRPDGLVTGPFVYRLKVFPSELRDYFDITSEDDAYRVTVQVFGDYTDKDGSPGLASFNRDNPRLLVTVHRVLESKGTVPVVEERLVELREPIDLGGNVLTIDALPYYGVFRISRNSVAPLAMVALLLLVTGAVMRLCFPRIEVLLLHESGAVSFHVMDDTYRERSRMHDRCSVAWGDGA